MFPRFNPFFMAVVMLFFAIALMPVLLYAQAAPGEFDWSSLGVDFVVVSSIISIVQFLKKYLPQKTLAWTPLVLAMVGSGIYGVITNLSGGVAFMIKMATGYAAAAAYIYEIGKTVGLEKILKGKTMVDSAGKDG